MKNRKWSPKKEPTHHRKRYVEKSRFYSWAQKLGLDRTPIGKNLLQLQEDYNVAQLVLLFLFCFSLSFLLFLNFEISTNFEVGGVARHTFKSPISFEMVDELATAKKRQEAEKSISPVYDFDADLFDRISARIFDAFAEMRNLISQKDWNEKTSVKTKKKEFAENKKVFEELIGDTIPQRLFDWLVIHRFSPEIEGGLVRSHEKWLEQKIVDGSVSEPGNVVLRLIPSRATPEEMSYEAKKFVSLSQRTSFKMASLEEELADAKLSARDFRNLNRLAYLLLKPNVTPNRQETSQRRKKAHDSVLPVVVAVKKNQVIVSEGTVVQPVHIQLMDQVRDLRANQRRDFQSLIAALLFMTFILVSFSYLKRFSLNRVFAANKDLLFMALVTAMMVVITKSFLFMTNAAFMEKLSDFIHPATFLFAAPVAAGPMLVGLVVTSGEIVWLFTVFLSVVLGLMVEQNFAFFLVSLISGMAAVRGVHSCKKRNDIYRAGMRTGLISALVIFLFMTIDNFNQPDYFSTLVWTVPAGFVAGILSSMVAMTLIPLLESTFNYTTDIRLLELSNLNHPLLKKMLIMAPGTYHHSMMVGSLVEAAAEQIGANPLLGKVMAYYHDIGKMEHAEYFIENQRKGKNPHDHISPYMSKTILIAHVKDGAELGMKYNLGKPIIDGILQHHGTGLIAYFYNKALQQVDEHCGPPSEDEFRYPGPKPQFREAALVMLADGIEAAARALDEPTPIRLQNIVRNIIQRRFMEAQLDDCNLTLRDLSACEASFNRILLGIYHQRIDYPKEHGGGMSEKSDSSGSGLRVMT